MINFFKINITYVANRLICLLVTFFLLFCDVTLSYSDTATLSPELGMTHPKTIAEMHVDFICELIEKRAKLWEGKSIEDIFIDDMLLWQNSQEPYLNLLVPVLSVDKNQIFIKVPHNDLTIRYYDVSAEKNLTLMPGTDINETKTEIINKRINRQIIKRNASVSLFDKPVIKTRKLTKEFAIKNRKILTSLNNKIQGVNWVPEQMASDFWAEGKFGLKEERIFYAKWEHSYICLNEREEICGLLIAYEMPAGEIPGVHDVAVYVHSIVVDEDYRFMGLASRMMNNLAADLCKSGYHVLSGRGVDPEICLQTGTKNVDALTFYKNLGFEVVGKKAYPDHDDQVLLAKADHVYKISAKRELLEGKNTDIEVVFFDWDGTIVDTTGKSVDNFAMVNKGLFHDKEEAVTFLKEHLDGKTVPDTFDLLKLYADEKNRKFPYKNDIEYGNKLDENRMELIGDDIPIVKGSLEFIKRLKKRGVKVHICSAMNIEGLKRQIGKLGIQALFDGIHGSPSSERDVFLTKGEYMKAVLEEGGFSRDRAFAFGDTIFDMEAARIAGIKGIGRAKNTEKEKELICSGAWFNVLHYESYEQIIKRMELDIKLKKVFDETAIDVRAEMSVYAAELKKGDLSSLNELKIIAAMLEPEENDILLYEPIKELLNLLRKIQRTLDQADILLMIDELSQYCSDTFISDNISPFLLIDAYLKRRDVFMSAPRPPIGPILGISLKKVSTLEIQNRIIGPLLEKIKDREFGYKCCDIFTQIASQLDPGINDIIFTEVVEKLLLYIDKSDYDSLRALNTIFHNSNIYKKERELLNEGQFDPENELLVKLNYVVWAKGIYRDSFYRYPSYSSYLKTIKMAVKNSGKLHIDDELLRDLRTVVYEAYLAREKILEIYDRAKEIGRELIVIENLSYGAVSLAPITNDVAGIKYIKGTDIEVISTKIASSGEQEILTSLLPFKAMETIAKEQPIVIIVDGTRNVINDCGRGEKTAQNPSSFLGYQKYIMAVNKALTGKIDPGDFYSFQSEVDKTEKDEEFKRLRTFYSYYAGDRSEKYMSFYWYPGNMIMRSRSSFIINKMNDVNVLNGPAVIYMQTVNDPESLDPEAKDYIGGEYVPGAFDDTGYFKGRRFIYDGKSSPRLSNDMAEESRRMFAEFCSDRDIDKGGEIVQEQLLSSEGKEKISEVEKFLFTNQKLLKTLLNKSNKEILLRVPVEAIEASGEDNINRVIDYLNAFQRSPNGYVELFYLTGTKAIREDQRGELNNKFKLNGKQLPADFEINRKNTITLFTLLKGHDPFISEDPLQAKKDINRILRSNLGCLEPGSTQIVPVGLKNDPMGIVRGTILGIQLIYIARYNEFEQNKGKGSDREFIDAFVEPAVEEYSKLCASLGVDKFDFTGKDLIDLASGNFNDRIRALKKLIDLLPIEPLDPEDIIRGYDHAKNFTISV